MVRPTYRAAADHAWTGVPPITPEVMTGQFRKRAPYAA